MGGNLDIFWLGDGGEPYSWGGGGGFGWGVGRGGGLLGGSEGVEETFLCFPNFFFHHK